MPLQVEPETLGLTHGRQLADRVLLEEGGVNVGDAHQRLFPGRLVVLNRLLEGSEGGGVILGGGDEPAKHSFPDRSQNFEVHHLMVEEGRLS